MPKKYITVTIDADEDIENTVDFEVNTEKKPDEIIDLITKALTSVKHNSISDITVSH